MTAMSLADRRTDYDWGTLERDDLDDDPIVQWWAWYRGRGGRLASRSPTR